MIVFHDGSNPAFAAYTGGRAWDDAAFVGATPNGFAGLNNTTAITTLFADAAARTPTTVGNMEQDLAGLIAAQTVNLYVLKGPHQFGGTPILNACHITVGYDGWLWHLEVWRTAGKKGAVVYTIMTATKGTVRYDDGDGFVVKRGR